MRADSFGRAYTRIHAPTQQNDGIHFSHESVSSIIASDTAQGGVPHNLVKLQAEPDLQSVLKHPLNQLPRLQPAPFSIGIIVNGREQDPAHPFGQPVLTAKFARELVVFAAGNDKFY